MFTYLRSLLSSFLIFLPDNFAAANHTQINSGRGFTPDFTGRAYSAPSDILDGGEGSGCPLPKNSTPASALPASSFGHSGLAVPSPPLDKASGSALGSANNNNISNNATIYNAPVPFILRLKGAKQYEGSYLALGANADKKLRLMS